MLYYSTIESSTLELLKKLQELPGLKNTFLVGGTALALQLGHRKSVNLDLFGEVTIDSLQLIQELSKVGKTIVRCGRCRLFMNRSIPMVHGF